MENMKLDKLPFPQRKKTSCYKSKRIREFVPCAFSQMPFTKERCPAMYERGTAVPPGGHELGVVLP